MPLTKEFFEAAGVPEDDYEALYKTYPSREGTGLLAVPNNCSMGLLSSITDYTRKLSPKAIQQIVAGTRLFSSLMYHGNRIGPSNEQANDILVKWGFTKVWEYMGSHNKVVEVLVFKCPNNLNEGSEHLEVNYAVAADKSRAEVNVLGRALRERENAAV